MPHTFSPPLPGLHFVSVKFCPACPLKCAMVLGGCVSFYWYFCVSGLSVSYTLGRSRHLKEETTSSCFTYGVYNATSNSINKGLDQPFILYNLYLVYVETSPSCTDLTFTLNPSSVLGTANIPTRNWKIKVRFPRTLRISGLSKLNQALRTVFFVTQPRLVSCRDGIPGLQSQTHGLRWIVLYAGFLIDRWSKKALSCCRWVPQLCLRHNGWASPHDHEVVGSGPDTCLTWLSFEPLSNISLRSLMEVEHY